MYRALGPHPFVNFSFKYPCKDGNGVAYSYYYKYVSLTVSSIHISLALSIRNLTPIALQESNNPDHYSLTNYNQTRIDKVGIGQS